MKNQYNKFLSLFLIGAIGYPLIEILFRGYSHISMSILGGICLVAIKTVDLLLGRVRRIWKAFICSVLITELEFITGMIVNVILKLDVWNYADRFGNFAGQVCPLFSFYWFLLSYLVLFVFSLEREYKKKKLYYNRRKNESATKKV